jgi:hypothetical protein
MSLDRDIAAFVNGHGDELTIDELFLLGRAAGIIARVHGGPYREDDHGPGPSTPAAAPDDSGV